MGNDKTDKAKSFSNPFKRKSNVNSNRTEQGSVTLPFSYVIVYYLFDYGYIFKSAQNFFFVNTCVLKRQERQNRKSIDANFC